MTIDGYILQVQGYASAVGSASLNQKLSMERADNVLTFLDQEGKVPVTNVLAPGAMGTTDQTADYFLTRFINNFTTGHNVGPTLL